ncbi:MAG: protein kinase [Spirulinaceae cyanobacterium]
MLADRVNYPLLGQLLKERYKIVQVLSTGAFGQTYIAEDITTSPIKRCVVKHRKIVGEYPSLLRTGRRLFHKEVEVLDKLRNYEQVPQLLAFFEESQGFYLIQELIAGQPLDAYLPLREYCGGWGCDGQVLNLLHNLLNILDFIHNQGVVHCDIKPNNLIRRSQDGKLVLIDFGAAQLIDISQPEQSFNTIPFKTTVAVSPLGYIAPEQLIGKPQANSDIYSVGSIAIQALTGLDPARLQLNLETGKISWRHLCRDNAIELGFSNQLAAIIDRMTCYDTQQRYQSAQEVIAALEPLCKLDLPQFVLFPGHRPDEQLLITEETIFEEELLNEPSLQEKPQKEDNKLSWPELTDNSIKLLDSGFLDLFKLFPVLTSLGVGMAAVNALAIAFGVHYLFNTNLADSGVDVLWEAEQAYGNGDLTEAISLAESVNQESSVYKKSQTRVAKWQQEWRSAKVQYEAAKTAFEQEKWQRVTAEAQKAPPSPFWQEKLAPLVEEAEVNLETNAEELLAKAFELAKEKEFTAALTYLEKIPADSAVGARVQPKLEEYRQKQRIRADFFLQKAYDLAEEGDFTEAIHYLEKVPLHTETGQIAMRKIVEYVEKEQQKQRAEQKAELQQLRSGNLNYFLSPATTTPSNSTFSNGLNPGEHLQEINTRGFQ